MVPDREFFADALAEVLAEAVRVDAKASTLLTLAGTALTVGLAVLARADLPDAALFTGCVTVALIGAAVALLAGAVRPALDGNFGFVRYAATTPIDLVADATGSDEESSTGQRAQQLVWLSRAVLTKYRRVRTAVDLLLTGLAGTAVTALLVLLR
ncbi:Pycsar system effector family protein [Micromonospora wenchangensis]|uniref:Pycsar system effector family protein n=1 Tax=Micromonospora wenchangensis TaxID=1185415 RepID=UPI003D7027F0